MTSSRWEIWISNPRGERLVLLEGLISLTFTRSLNSVGQFEVVIPELYRDYLGLDHLVEIWRATEDGPLQLLRIGLIRNWKSAMGLLTVRGPDQLEFLRRRIHLGESQKSGNADDLLTELVDENFVSASDSDRIMGNISLGTLSSLGPVITRSPLYANVLDELQGICKSCDEIGSPLFFDLIPVYNADSISFRFETFMGQPGIDKSSSGSHPLYFGEKYGNMTGSTYEFDGRSEFTVAYAGSKGENNIVEVTSDRSLDSPWNRREIFVNSSSGEGSSSASSDGQSELNDSKPTESFDGTFVDVVGCQYGTDWVEGDRVIVEIDNQSVDCLIRSISIQLGKNTLLTSSESTKNVIDDSVLITGEYQSDEASSQAIPGNRSVVMNQQYLKSHPGMVREKNHIAKLKVRLEKKK